MLRAYKYRLYPNSGQSAKIEQHFGSCRLVWNLALSAKRYAYESNRITVSRYDLQKQLVELKSEHDWLYDINSQSLQSVLLHLDSAYSNFFKGGGFPKYKSKIGHQSFQCPQGVLVDFGCGTISLPKIKFINTRFSKQFSGKIKTCTISRTPTRKYFISILVENDFELPVKPPVIKATTIGIDVGIKSFVVTSDGRTYEPNRFLKNSLKRLKCLQRRACRKKKGSNNRKKSNLHVARLHEKITNQRTDYIHKITTELIGDNQTETFVIENLNIAGMVNNRKLSQAISDVAFGELFRQMKYKSDWYGKNLIEIDRFAPSSKKCSACGVINTSLTLADREWTCNSCGTHHHRDENAAINIEEFGLQQTILNNKTPEGIREEPVELRRLRRAKKQESMLV